MPKLERVVCKLGRVGIYRGGDYVQGEWVVHIGTPVKVKCINVTIYGATFVKWTEVSLSPRESDKLFITHEQHIKETKSFASTETEIQPGVYKYPFKFYLPKDRMPSSFQGRYGATKWYIRLHIGRSMPFPDLVDQFRMFTFLDDYPLSIPFYSKPVENGGQFPLSKAFGIGDGGTVKLHASLDRRGFCAGEYARLTVVAENNCTKDLGKVQAKLFQEVLFKGNGEEKRTLTCLRSIVGEPLKKGEKCHWKNQRVTIDAVPNTTQRRSTYCINVYYFIKVIVPVPFYNGSDIEIRLNIEIGTSPSNKPVGNTSAPTGEIPVTNASSAVTYTNCNKGWEQFNESNSYYTVPRSNYTPMCVFNTNYVPQQTAQQGQNKSATQGQQGASAMPKKLVTPKTPASSNAVVSVASDTVPPTNATHDLPMPEPSAPPSYDSVFGTATNITEESDDEDDDACSVIVRFPLDRLELIGNRIRQNKSHIEKFRGRALLISTKIEKVSKGWPQDMMLALLQFECSKDAMDWLKLTNRSSEDKWLEGSQILKTKLKEKYQDGKKVLTLSMSKKKEGFDSSKMEEFKKIALDYMKPLRLSRGGVLLIGASSTETMQGDWSLDSNEFLTVTLWNSLDTKPDYSKVLPAEVYDRYKKLSSELFSSQCFVIFAVESLEETDSAVLTQGDISTV